MDNSLPKFKFNLRTIVTISIAFISLYLLGKKLLKYRYAKPSKKDKRDYRIASVGEDTYPEAFSLPTPPVKDQKDRSSCVAHSMSYLCESVLNKKDNIKDRLFSTGFIYGYRPKGYYQGEGMYPREALKTLLDVGNVPRQVFPYNEEVPLAIQMINNRLGEMLNIAKGFKISNFFILEKENEIKKCLTKYSPVTVMYPVYGCLENPINGKVEYDGGKEFRGYHQMTIYGWSGRYWKVLNSWGLGWDKDAEQDGAMLISMAYPVMECWGISSDVKASVPPVRKSWWSRNFGWLF